MKQKKILSQWHAKATRSGRKCLTVPPEFTKLSCGCLRNLEDEPFYMRKQTKGWVHVTSAKKFWKHGVRPRCRSEVTLDFQVPAEEKRRERFVDPFDTPGSFYPVEEGLVG